MQSMEMDSVQYHSYEMQGLTCIYCITECLTQDVSPPSQRFLTPTKCLSL